ncbi:thioesterase [bacterium]|nr:thioesterase [bacterium]PIV80742.1 MAG: putative thioesterase [bacterium CG17_big_fil_post_rev_8_21_14_2_50_64_8]PJA73639.1 MAG: putative thioesterase [bacterium CG_4_9_14_3_um_filter_65_15]
MAPANPWFPNRPADRPPRARLFCIPFAGGAPTVFHGWQARFPADIEVCPLHFPGRGNRLREPSLRRMSSLIEQAAEAMAPLLNVPYAVLGHSLGALIGYELVVHLRQAGQAEPFLLIASGARGPHIPDPFPPLHHLPQDEFIRGMQERYGGIPEEILAEPDLVALLVPPLQADLELFETYRYTPGEPLGCPIATFGGRDDHRVGEDQYRSWQEVTTGPVNMTMFPGGHFFIQQQGPAVALATAQACERALAGA